METNFDKPLEQRVAENAQDIATLNNKITNLEGKTDTYNQGTTTIELKSYPAIVNLRESGGSGITGLIFVQSATACYGYNLGSGVKGVSMSNGNLVINVGSGAPALGYAVMY